MKPEPAGHHHGAGPMIPQTFVDPVVQLRLVRRFEFFARVAEELEHAYGKHGSERWGRHEFYGVLREEVDELWDEIKADAPQERLLEELVQVAAMCFRYYETGDRYRGDSA